MKTGLLLVILVGVSGCTHTALRDSTLSQSSTIVDMHYEMVLSNLAMKADRPYALPWGMKVTQGNVTVSDNANVNFSYAWPLQAGGRSLGSNPSRNWQLSWTIIPVTDQEDIVAMDQQYATVLAAATTFYHVGKVAPPGNICGHYGATVVWVDPRNKGDMEKLNQLVGGVLGAMKSTSKAQQIAIPGYKPTTVQQ